MPQAVPQSPRTRAMLAAVADGRAQVSNSCEPDMFIDGLACCDQTLAHTLTHAGLIRPIGPATPSHRRAVALTAQGVAALAQQAGPLVGRQATQFAEPMSQREAS